jgi:hypothetical protein
MVALMKGSSLQKAWVNLRKKEFYEIAPKTNTPAHFAGASMTKGKESFMALAPTFLGPGPML